MMKPILPDQVAARRTLPTLGWGRVLTEVVLAMQKFPILRFVWVGMSVLAVAHLVVFAWGILTAPDTVQVQYMPDDAYYYLGLAKNYVLTGSWTFDSGVSVTSGFHPLLAYLLSFLYRLTSSSTAGPSTTDFVTYALLLSSGVALAIAVGAAYIGLIQERYPHYLLFLALLLTSRNYGINSISVMEWPLVLLFSMLYVFVFCHSFQKEKRAYVQLFLIALAGSLARSDFGLLPFSLLAAAAPVFIFFRNKLSHEVVPNLLAGLLGASAGVGLIFAHNYLLFGSFLQSSALMKAYWAQVSGISYQRVMPVLLEAVGWSLNFSILPWILLVLSLALSPFIVRGIRESGIRLDLKSWDERLNKASVLDLLLFASALICIVGYALVYSRGSDVQKWYTANLLVPIFLLLVIGYRYLSLVVAHRQLRLVSVWLTVGVIALMRLNVLSLHVISPNAVPPNPHQTATLAAGKYLHLNPVEGRVGAWNAGIIGYYQGGQVVNLDGLVNNDIYEYAVSNSTPAYITQTGITHIADYETMLVSEIGRVRGGYDDADFIARLQPIKVFDHDQQNMWTNFTLYKVLP